MFLNIIESVSLQNINFNNGSDANLREVLNFYKDINELQNNKIYISKCNNS